MRKKGPNRGLICPVRLTGSNVHAASSEANMPVTMESVEHMADSAWRSAGAPALVRPMEDTVNKVSDPEMVERSHCTQHTTGLQIN